MEPSGKKAEGLPARPGGVARNRKGFDCRLKRGEPVSHHDCQLGRIRWEREGGLPENSERDQHAGRRDETAGRASPQKGRPQGGLEVTLLLSLTNVACEAIIRMKGAGSR